MKNSLIDILLSLFESALEPHNKTDNQENTLQEDFKVIREGETTAEFVKSKNTDSLRVLSFEERIKLTKPAHQLLLQIYASEILPHDVIEVILNKLVEKNIDNYITYDDIKYIIKSTLKSEMDDKQLAIIDLLFYQKEDGQSFH